ncbi:22185_t:CDS:2, partial [Cetraspora pellucida]
NNALYDDNQIEYETNVMMNSESTYYEDAQTNMASWDWNLIANRIDELCKNYQNDNEFDILYNNNHVKFNVSSNVLCNITQNKYECNNVEDVENNRYSELREEVKRYEKEQGFRMCCYHVEKSKNGDIQRCMLVCEHFGQPEIMKSKDPKKKTTSKCIGCTWQINLSCLEKENPHKIIYITKLVDEHKNHDLDLSRYNFQENIEFTTEMIQDQVRKALEEKYFIKIYMPVLHRKEADPQWYVQVDWDSNSKATNHYEMALSLFLVVDNHLSSRLVAQALTDDETKEMHSWILQQIKKATHDAIPQVIFTDADPALVAAIRDEFPTTNALHCMFHITQNIAFNLKNHLKDQYDEFVKNFFKVQQIGFVPIFEYRWKLLLEKYNNVNLVDKLMACVLEEDKKTDYALFHASIPKAALVATASTILSNVCEMLRKHLIVEILKIQENQIKQLLQYHAVIVTQSELQRYHAINFNDPAIFENQNYTDIIAKAMLNL